jgi:hypothetical protein
MPPMMMASYLGPLPLERLAEDARRMIASGNGLPVDEGGWTWVGLAQVLSGSTEEGFANLRRGRAALRDLGLAIPLGRGVGRGPLSTARLVTEATVHSRSVRPRGLVTEAAASSLGI